MSKEAGCPMFFDESGGENFPCLIILKGADG